MAMKNPYTTYKNTAVNTSTPAELTLMLYNGCLKFIHLTKKAIEENNFQEKNKNIMKAQDIIKELMVTLNTDQEVGKNMMRMYDYMLTQLVQANINNDINLLNEVEVYTIQFRDTWKDVIALTKKEKLATGSNS